MVVLLSFFSTFPPAIVHVCPFLQLWPDKFQNKTNGVTQRRWLAFCNPPLRKLISKTLGSEKWITDLYQVQVRARAFLVQQMLLVFLTPQWLKIFSG